MVGLVDSMNSVDRKRKHADIREVEYPSTPRWYFALKRYLIEKECPPISLSDVTRIVVESGFFQAIDICHLSQTCTDLRKAANHNDVWSSMCHQEFPSGTRHLPQECIEEKGYKWLYREWKSSIHDRDSEANSNIPLPPPRLSSDQLFLYSHVTVNNRPVHFSPIVLTGNDLSPLLNTGQVSFRLPEPLALWSVQENGSALKVASQDETPFCREILRSCPLNLLRHQMHLFSSYDGSMRCVFDQKPSRSIQRKSYCAMIHGQRDGDDETFIDFGPDSTSCNRCQLPLRSSPAAVAIKSLFSESIIFNVGCYVCVVKKDGKDMFAITAIDILIRKFDKKRASECDVFNSTQLKENGGVTLLHYISELQF